VPEGTGESAFDASILANLGQSREAARRRRSRCRRRDAMARRMRGYDDAQARQIFRDLIDMQADVAITPAEIDPLLDLQVLQGAIALDLNQKL
jgi:hypothetical protein